MAPLRTKRPVMLQEQCKLCQMCRYLCPDLAITKDEQAGLMRIDLRYCKGCGICAAFCPERVIKMIGEKEMNE